MSQDQIKLINSLAGRARLDIDNLLGFFGLLIEIDREKSEFSEHTKRQKVDFSDPVEHDKQFFRQD